MLTLKSNAPMSLFPGEDMTSVAVFDDDQEYRYSLLRTWNPYRPRLAFLMLNPSTADQDTNDPTVRRCLGFAKDWGFGSLQVLNLFALRSTDPRGLYSHRDPIGPENDHYIHDAAESGVQIVTAWGNHGWFGMRGTRVLETLKGKGAQHLGLTGEGHPRHPLYLRRDVARIGWEE